MRKLDLLKNIDLGNSVAEFDLPEADRGRGAVRGAVHLWKTYFLSLAGSWLLKLCDEGEHTDHMRDLRALLERASLLSPDDAPSTVLRSVVDLSGACCGPRRSRRA